MQRTSSGGSASSPTSAGQASPSSTKARKGAPRVSGSSISSLHDLMDRAAADAPSRRSSLPHHGPAAPTPRSRRASHDVDARQKAGKDGELSELSWGKWWPFAVVEPEGSADARTAAGTVQEAAAAPLPPTPPAKDTHEASRGFLSLFAGKQAVEDAQAQAISQARQDQLEAELLDASLDELSIAASRSTDSFALDADEVPPGSPPKQTIAQRRLLDKSLPPAPDRSSSSPSTSPSKSFFPSLFSPSSVASAADTASASLSTTTSRLSSVTGNAAASLASTTSRMTGSSTSLLDSLTIANPFNSSPASFFTSAAKSPGPRSPASPFEQPHRHYSTKRHPSADEGPTAKPSDVENLVDEPDRQAIKEEVEENAEIFSILKDKYRAPKHPLVFCHGLFGFDSIGLAGVKPLSFSYWIGVEEALQAMGAEVMIGRVPASASIEERAKVLCQLIGERFPGREVNLIGHSMVRSPPPLVRFAPHHSVLTPTGRARAGRSRRPVPHLSPQTDKLQGPVPDDHLDAAPRLVICRLPPRGHPRRAARPFVPGRHEGARRSGWRRGFQRLDNVRARHSSTSCACAELILRNSRTGPRWRASTKRRPMTRASSTSATAQSLRRAGATRSGSRGASCTSERVRACFRLSGTRRLASAWAHRASLVTQSRALR